MSIALRFEVGGQERRIELGEAPLQLGRGRDNDVVLPDYSVSRRHARISRKGGAWMVEDLDSTNGLEVNHTAVRQSPLSAGDLLKVGIFEIKIEPGKDAQPAEPDSIPNATIVRKLSDLPRFDLDIPETIMGPESEAGQERPTTADTDDSRGRKFFTYLNQLARDLIHTDTSEDVLRKVMDIAFDALPVERGFILLGTTKDDAICELMRVGTEVTEHPDEEVPISTTILQAVMEGEMGLLTVDALDDERLTGGKSIVLHGIRAAMCAPLWSQDKITGFIQVDTPLHAGTFREEHLDFLITLANYAAVGVQRVEERRKRGRLERYHSPAVLEEAMRDLDEDEAGAPRLRNREVTVMFGDLVGFTAFSESAPLERVAELLTGYFNISVDAIFKQGGTLDKYIGDCVMAFFGAPLQQEDHAQRGVAAAVEIQKAMREWNAEREKEGQPPVYCRLAINTGPVVVGDVGSERRVDYTVLGNTVNVAARLESSVAKPGQIVIGEATAKLLNGQFELEALGDTTLKGLQQKVAAFRVVDI